MNVVYIDKFKFSRALNAKDIKNLSTEGKGCVQIEVLSGNHKTKSAVLFRLLTKQKQEKKLDSRVTYTKKVGKDYSD